VLTFISILAANHAVPTTIIAMELSNFQPQTLIPTEIKSQKPSKQNQRSSSNEVCA